MNFFSVLFLILIVPAPAPLQQQTLDAWNSYIETTEKRIDNELATPSLAPPTTTPAAVTGHHIEVPGGIIRYWPGAIFLPAITHDAPLRWPPHSLQHHRS